MGQAHRFEQRAVEGDDVPGRDGEGEADLAVEGQQVLGSGGDGGGGDAAHVPMISTKSLYLGHLSSAHEGCVNIMARASSEGLSVGYRILYRIRYIGLHVFGPAQLGDTDD